MSWKRRKRHRTPESGGAGLEPAKPQGARLPGPAPAPAKGQPDARFGQLFERIADMVKSEMASGERLGTMAFFVYGGSLKQEGPEQSTVKAVSLAWKTEFQKELIRKRVRDKAWTEEASAVVIVTDAEAGPASERQESALKRRGTVVISGASPGATATATLAYAVEGAGKTVTLGEMQWLSESPYNFFLEGILTKRHERGRKGTQTA